MDSTEINVMHWKVNGKVDDESGDKMMLKVSRCKIRGRKFIFHTD
jgi:hypothetical protein